MRRRAECKLKMDAEFVCRGNLNANFILHHLSNNQGSEYPNSM
jgi:hypothetical protein